MVFGFVIDVTATAALAVPAAAAVAALATDVVPPLETEAVAVLVTDEVATGAVAIVLGLVVLLGGLVCMMR